MTARTWPHLTPARETQLLRIHDETRHPDPLTWTDPMRLAVLDGLAACHSKPEIAKRVGVTQPQLTAWMKASRIRPVYARKGKPRGGFSTRFCAAQAGVSA